MELGDLLLLLLLFIYWRLWDPALRCDDFIREFGFSCIDRFIPTVTSLF